MKPTTRREVAPLVSSWGALALAIVSAVTVFIVALAVVAYVRRDDVAPRAHGPVALVVDAGRSTSPLDDGPSHAVVVDTSPIAGDAGASGVLGVDDDGGAGEHVSDGGRRAAVDVASVNTGSLDVAEIARAFFAPHEATLVACVRDARRRDPATDDRVSFVIIIGEGGSVDALRVSRPPSPFATRCLLDVASRPLEAAGAVVDVDASTLGSTFKITRVSAPRSP